MTKPKTHSAQTRQTEPPRCPKCKSVAEPCPVAHTDGKQYFICKFATCGQHWSAAAVSETAPAPSRPTIAELNAEIDKQIAEIDAAEAAEQSSQPPPWAENLFVLAGFLHSVILSGERLTEKESVEVSRALAASLKRAISWRRCY
jgi:hypothetical protein